jgi:hypothetical protein
MQDPVHHLREERDTEGLVGVPEGELQIPKCLYNESPYRLEQLRSVPPDQSMA